jgi:GNAT acetyltransferase-like protein
VNQIRRFRKEDIPAVVALRATAFRNSEQDDAEARAAYFAEIFFGNPWYDDALPSVVCEREDGEIIGFLGVVPRRMAAAGRALRVATTTQLMVAPSAPPMVAAQLLRTVFAGPQDLCVADVSSATSRALWERLGGVTAASSSLTWMRMLRPFRQLLTAGGGGGLAARAAARLARPLDALAGRLLPSVPAAPARHGARREMTDAELLSSLLRGLDGRPIRGDYDAASLDWLLDMLARKRAYGTLRRAQVVDERGTLLGWYLVFLPRDGNARVAHLEARADAAGAVLDHLFAEARAARCTAVSGRFDARLLEALAARRCVFYGPGSWVLLHARDRALLDAVARDEVALTRLDAEWWLAF